MLVACVVFNLLVFDCRDGSECFGHLSSSVPVLGAAALIGYFWSPAVWPCMLCRFCMWWSSSKISRRAMPALWLSLSSCSHTLFWALVCRMSVMLACATPKSSLQMRRVKAWRQVGSFYSLSLLLLTSIWCCRFFLNAFYIFNVFFFVSYRRKPGTFGVKIGNPDQALLCAYKVSWIDYFYICFWALMFCTVYISLFGPRLWHVFVDIMEVHCILAVFSPHRSLQDVQIWFQPNQGAAAAPLFLPACSASQDGFGMTADFMLYPFFFVWI